MKRSGCSIETLAIQEVGERMQKRRINSEDAHIPDSKPAALFIGNFLAKSNGANPPSQLVADLLVARGWSVFVTSDQIVRYSRLLDMMRTVWRLRRRYNFAHVDVFSGNAFIWAWSVCWLLRSLGKPYVLTLHGGNLPVFAKRWPGWVRRLLKSAVAVTVPSRYLQEQMKPYGDELLLLPNALDLQRYRFRIRTGAQPRLVWLRAFHDVYNPSLAPRVIAALVEEFPEITLSMVGRDKKDGSFQATRLMAGKLGVTAHMEFPGGIAKSEVPLWLDQYDVFLNTTNIDNTPVSVMEAMASGLCVVSTNVGGIPYLLDDEEDALLVPPGDAEAMAQAIRRVLSDHGLAERLSRNARAKVERFDLSAVASQWVELLETVAGRERGIRVHTSSRSSVPVLYVGNFFSSVIGANSLSEELAEHLDADGWEVLMTSVVVNRAGRLFDMMTTIWRWRHRYKVAHVDVFSGNAFIWASLVCWLLRQMGKPYVLTLRGGNLPEFAKRWPGRVRRLLKSAAAVTAPSRYLQEQMKPYGEGFLLLPNSLDINQYRFRARSGVQPRMVWLRAFHAIYNPSLAPRVIAELVSEYPEIRLTMVGRDKKDGSLQATREKAAELGVDEHLEFPGGITKSDVPHWLDRYDIFLNTTNVDNTPVSVMEAMACGLCVVSTDVGGIPYLLNHEKDALLVPPDDPEAMAQAIRRVLSDPGLAGELSRNARAKAQQWDWSITLPRWESLINSIRLDSMQSPKGVDKGSG
jgi:glycosyltransferase involved in cell wall biosynthesis